MSRNTTHKVRAGSPPGAGFNGRRYQNPNGRAGNGFAHFVRWITTSKRARWPKRLEDRVAPHILEGPRSSDQIAATFIGHSTFLIQCAGRNLLTDPVFSERVGPWNLGGPRRARPPGVDFQELPRIDLVLLSHNHYDHADMATLVRLKRSFDPLIVTTLGNQRFLRRHGFSRVVELDWWNEIDALPGLQILSTPAQHFSSRHVFDRDKTLWGGFVITAGEHRVYFVGDSGYGPHFKQVGEHVPGIQMALVPIGAYEPRWFMKRAHVNPEEAVQIHLDVRPRISVGMHFGTFQLTDEAIDDPPRHLLEALDKHGVPRDEFVVPKFGQTIIVPAGNGSR
jgi:L-ascorbate metabolism protein UlaG (beta-lactamase superfamily)